MTTAQLNVIDLSNFTGEITDAIAQCWWGLGVRGAVVGCQDVAIATQQATVLLRNGFSVHLYAFMYWGLSTLPEVQKCYMVAAAVGLAGTRIWLDCEAQVPNEAAGQTPDGRVAQLAVVRADVTAHGFTTGIYSGIYYWPTYMGNTTRFSTDPFWLADYFDDHRVVETVNVGGWTAVAMHQFAGSTELCGVDVDEDDDITGICSHTQPAPEDDMDYQVRRLLARGQIDPQTKAVVDTTNNAAVDRVIAALDAALTGVVTEAHNDTIGQAVLNAAVEKRLDLINVASGDYTAMLAAHDKVFGS